MKSFDIKFNSETYHILIKHLQKQDPTKAMALLVEANNNNVELSSECYKILLDITIETQQEITPLQLYEMMIQKKVALSVHVFNSLIKWAIRFLLCFAIEC